MKEFEEKRKELDELQTPTDFEARLRNKLSTVKPKKKRIAPWLIAAAILCIAFASINYPALAFYGKTLFGYEELMSETIQKLNEEGYGQAVNERITLHDGTVFTIEGIMSDRNQFEMYYSVTGDGMDFFDEFHFPKIYWHTKRYNASKGTFDSKQNKGIQTFESVSPFAKKLTMEFRYKDRPYNITFPYDAGKAIPVTLQAKVNETFEFDFGTLAFEKITATKGTTRIEGKLKELTDRNMIYDFSNIYLLVDGVELGYVGFGMSSASTPSTYDYEIDYAGLPSNVNQLAIKVDQFKGKENFSQYIPAKVGTHQIGPVALEILSIERENSKTKIRISSSADTLFDGVWLKTKSMEYPLEGSEGYNEADEMKERTLTFSTTDEVESIYIENVYYNKAYSEVIDIPIK